MDYQKKAECKDERSSSQDSTPSPARQTSRHAIHYELLRAVPLDLLELSSTGLNDPSDVVHV